MNKLSTIATGLLLAAITAITACSSGGNGSNKQPPPVAPAAPSIMVDADIKQLIFNWASVGGTDYYRLMENADGHSGFTQVGGNIPAGSLSVTRPIAVHLTDFVEAQYIIEACNVTACASSDVVTVIDVMLDTIGYFKASNTGLQDIFGLRVALSADGNTLAVGAIQEDSNTTGINGDQNDDSEGNSGAVYVFRFNGTDWFQQAYIKASNTRITGPNLGLTFGEFGYAVALSADGNTLAVGAPLDSSSATGINGDQNVGDQFSDESGAVYLFRFDGTDWFQEAYVKASNTGRGDRFGSSIALSANGNTIAVGAIFESSGATGINGNQGGSVAGFQSGAAYLFRFDGVTWFQEAYIKASNTGSDPLGFGNGDEFGYAVALGADGNTLAVSAHWEFSNATGINGDQNDNSIAYAGAVYLFRFDGSAWFQEAYIKASNTGRDDHGEGDEFGASIALSADGATLAVGAWEHSGATGINGDQNDDSAEVAGAVYLFRFDNSDWSQEAYIKASNTGSDPLGFGNGDGFGNVALSADGNTLAVGAAAEDSGATGINGDQNDDVTTDAGAVYLFRFDGLNWFQKAYIKASNTGLGDRFGQNVALSADGNTLAVGAFKEDSGTTGINGDQNDDSVENAGAVYVY